MVDDPAPDRERERTNFECKDCGLTLQLEDSRLLVLVTTGCPDCGGFEWQTVRAGDEPLCDFCSSPNSRWLFPCREYLMPSPIPGLPGFANKGPWGACPQCRSLILKGDRERLAVRSARRFRRKHPEQGVSLPELVKQTRRMHDFFWTNREGPPIEVKERT